ncbi:UDP-3-O-acyl-N-acetylglucosamine deacetylase [Alphaproteobacteria bacterium]
MNVRKENWRNCGFKKVQKTIAFTVSVSGIGIHSGKHVTMQIAPADCGAGIVFCRTDLHCNNIIPAKFDRVISTLPMCTAVANEDGAQVMTIEHLMSAFWGCEIDNAIVSLNGPEVPIMDGSADYFVQAIQRAGNVTQSAKRKVIRVLKAVEVARGDTNIMLSPCAAGNELSVEFFIDFINITVGKQSFVFSADQASFALAIGKARTFGFIEELTRLREMGLANGASLDNAIAIGADGIMNEGGLRYENEFVRHKILDCIGDLYLAGARVVCNVKAVKTGHVMNNLVLKKLLSDPESYVIC